MALVSTQMHYTVLHAFFACLTDFGTLIPSIKYTNFLVLCIWEGGNEKCKCNLLSQVNSYCCPAQFFNSWVYGCYIRYLLQHSCEFFLKWLLGFFTFIMSIRLGFSCAGQNRCLKILNRWCIFKMGYLVKPLVDLWKVLKTPILNNQNHVH